jgi:hypothetical protein
MIQTPDLRSLYLGGTRRGDRRRGAGRRIKDTSAAGNRYHNKRFAVLAAEMGLRPPGKPAPILGFSAATITDEYTEVIEGITAARLPYLTGQSGTTTRGTGGGEDDDSQR